MTIFDNARQWLKWLVTSSYFKKATVDYSRVLEQLVFLSAVVGLLKESRVVHQL